MSSFDWTIPITVKPEEWSKDDRILHKLLCGPLHQKEYIKEVGRLLKIVIKGEAFTPDNLDAIWAAQAHKDDENEDEDENKVENGDENASESENVIENIHYLLVELAPNLTPQHLDRLIDKFKNDWRNKVRRDLLLELAQRIAAKDVRSDALMTQKILTFLWYCALSCKNVYSVLKAFINVLRSTRSKDADGQKKYWLDKFVAELKANDKFKRDALKFITDICQLYDPPMESSIMNYISLRNQRSDRKLSRVAVLQRLEKDHNLIDWICEDLKSSSSKPENSSEKNWSRSWIFWDVVVDLLRFLSFLLASGRHWLSYKHATVIWESLIVRDIIRPQVRGYAFEFFVDLIGEKQSFHPSNIETFFVNNILQLDPNLLNERGIECFQAYFDAVNELPVTPRRRFSSSKSDIITFLDSADLIGIDYVSEAVRNSNEEISNESMKMLIEEQAKFAIDSEQLEELLKCPVCSSSLKLPVHACFSGHLACNCCSIRVSICPVCNDSFIRNEPRVINELLKLIPVSCKNRENGCSVKLPSPGMVKHERNCDYRFVKCLLCNDKVLTFRQLGDHFSGDHSVNEVDFSSWHVIDIDTSVGDNVSFLFFNEIQTYFVFRFIVIYKNALAYVCFHYIGKIENACQYLYDIRIDQGNGNDETDDCYYCFSGHCLPYFESSDQLKRVSRVFPIELKKIFFEQVNPTKFKVEIRIRKKAESLRKK